MYQVPSVCHSRCWGKSDEQDRQAPGLHCYGDNSKETQTAEMTSESEVCHVTVKA